VNYPNFYSHFNKYHKTTSRQRYRQREAQKISLFLNHQAKPLCSSV